MEKRHIYEHADYIDIVKGISDLLVIHKIHIILLDLRLLIKCVHYINILNQAKRHMCKGIFLSIHH